MKKAYYVIIIILTFIPLAYADQWPENDQDFMNELNIIKNPFENGIPKPVVAQAQVIKNVSTTNPVSIPVLKPHAPVIPPVVLPSFNLQGVMVGDDLHEAIINDQVVSMYGSIEGAKLISVTKKGIILFYKGKKFFLKVD